MDRKSTLIQSKYDSDVADLQGVYLVDDYIMSPIVDSEFFQEDLHLRNFRKILNEFSWQHQIMEDEFKKVIEIHIPKTIEKLTGEKQSMDRWHYATNTVVGAGSAVALGGLFVPGVGTFISLAGSIISLTGWIADTYMQKKRNIDQKNCKKILK